MSLRQAIFRKLFGECDNYQHQFNEGTLVHDEKKEFAILCRECRLCGRDHRMLVVQKPILRLDDTSAKFLNDMQNILDSHYGGPDMEQTKDQLILELRARFRQFYNHDSDTKFHLLR